MKKYTSIFKLSFVFYTLMVWEYLSGERWTSFVQLLFICSIIYQLIYLIFLRRKENIKFSTSIRLYFLYAISSISISMLIEYIKIFVLGYKPTDIIGNSSGEVYYGFEAIKENGWHNMIYIPWFIMNIIIIIINFYITTKEKRKTFNKSI